MANEPTFVPTVNPKFGLGDSREPNVRRIQYGDGYTGRQPDGINTDRQKITLTWENLLASEVEPMFRFFEALRGSDAFIYEVPMGLGDSWFELSIQGQSSTQATFFTTIQTVHTDGNGSLPVVELTGGFALADPKLYANGVQVALAASNDFNNAAWTKTRLAVQAGLIKTPSGLYMRNQLFETGANSTTHILQSPNAAKAASAMPIKSVLYLKPLGTRRHFAVSVQTAGGAALLWANLSSTGTVAGVSSSGDMSAPVASVRKLGGQVAKYIAPKYSVDRDDVNAYSLKVDIEQVFEG